MKAQSEQNSNAAERRVHRRRLRVVLLAIVTMVLFALIFVQAAFNTLDWLRPSSVSETFSLYALSTINFLAFVVLLMVLIRNIIKLRRERLERRLGARFKTRIVVFFIALSTLPVIFLFFATRGFINRSMDKWFSLPGNEMLTNAWQIQNAYVDGEQKGLTLDAVAITRAISRVDPDQVASVLAEEAEQQQLLMAELYDADGRLMIRVAKPEAKKLSPEFQQSVERARANALLGDPVDPPQITDGENRAIGLISAVPMPPGRGRVLVVARQIRENLVGSVAQIRKFQTDYELLKEKQNLVRSTSMLTLGLITLLVLFIAYWLAIYVARSLTDPVQQLAQATERVKRGDLEYRAGVVGDDELAQLALSFNEMTAEISENRQRLEHSASELQSINAALDERRHYIETVLQSLSAGVISLDEKGDVTMINEAARQMLRIEEAAIGVSLESLIPEEQREELRRMIQRAARTRSVTSDLHFTLAKQSKLDAAVTVTALEDRPGQSHGAVIVIEDLTELIEAQRRAAWSEVARRMAHEIKNPLTPIRLSAERLAKNLLMDHNGDGESFLTSRQQRLVRECSTMIGAEVATLQRMVDEFSNFARLPKAHLETAVLNDVVRNAVKLYDERLDSVALNTSLAEGLPYVMVDAEQIKRAIVNLIDNAAEALTDARGERRIVISTAENQKRDVIELSIADTGPGIPAQDRERIFDPYFSTRKRGTGLGLAIVSRIIAEHQGRIRVQENKPHGARFVIELPSAKAEI
jgi:two-component system nitrogen regulation sensor histidine kinase NtrY